MSPAFAILLLFAVAGDDVDRLSTAVDAALASPDPFRTRFEIVHLAPQSIGDEASWHDAVPIEKFEFTWTQAVGAVAIQMTREEPDAPERPPSVVVSHWNGSTWYDRLQGGRTWRVAPAWPQSLEFDSIGFFNGIDSPTFLGYSLSDVLSCLTVVDVRTVAGYIEVELMTEDHLRNRATIRFIEGSFAVHSVNYMIYDSSRNLALRVHYHVEEWLHDGTSRIPAVAYRDAYRPNNIDGVGGEATRSVYRRFEWTPLDVSENLEAFQPGPGHLFVDERLGVRYRLGGSRIFSDRITLTSQTPLASSNLEGITRAMRQSSEEMRVGAAPTMAVAKRIQPAVAIFVGSLALMVCGCIFARGKVRVTCAALSAPWAIVSGFMLLSDSIKAASAEDGVQALRGNLHHDFGDIPFDDTLIILEHLFVLRNESGETVRIQQIRSTCGCAAAQVEPAIVRPGEEIEVPATLHIQSAGRRVETLSFVLDTGEIVQLRMSATPFRRVSLRLSHASVVSPSQDIVVLVASVIEGGNDPPLEPSVVVPPGVEVEFDGWEPVHLSKRDSGKSSQWHGTLRINTLMSLPAGSRVKIALGGQVESVELSGRPWRKSCNQESSRESR